MGSSLMKWPQFKYALAALMAIYAGLVGHSITNGFIIHSVLNMKDLLMNISFMIAFIGRPFMNGLIVNEVASKAQIHVSQHKCAVSLPGVVL